ncbi:hypothetical protein [Peribacillus alkalitolerans]|uniref:hypothetical protein n=1 Tax=Peribacillus alkalitolerans TaxID=1550385 RepID=UPI0013CFEC3B|nr:hypothetical protein [Peribacillus alkalitolerans]
MKRAPLERPTDYYDENLKSLDDELCSLLKKRKDLSNNNPGFPPSEYISNWAKKYGFYEDFLHSFFSSLRMEEHFRPRVEPEGYRRQIPFFQSFEQDEYLYSVTVIQQYQNASVVNFHVDWDGTKDSPENRRKHRSFELFLGDDYDCRNGNGRGSNGHFSHTFIVSPPLPDDLSEIEFVFKEYTTPLNEHPTGLEMVFSARSK